MAKKLTSIFKEKTFIKSLFFTEGNNEVTKLYLGDNFKNFLKLSPNDLTIVELPPYQTLSEPMNDFDIRKHYGEAIIKTPQQILQEMHVVINSDSKTLSDGDANLWYYLHELGDLRNVYCYWDADRAEWICDEDDASASTLDVGSRVFAPEA